MCKNNMTILFKTCLKLTVKGTIYYCHIEFLNVIISNCFCNLTFCQSLKSKIFSRHKIDHSIGKLKIDLCLSSSDGIVTVCLKYMLSFPLQIQKYFINFNKNILSMGERNYYQIILNCSSYLLLL